jgi:hypothetical protein
LLTAHPAKMRILSKRSESKDLTSHPMKVRFAHPGGTYQGPVAGNVYPTIPDPVGERPSEASDLSENPARGPYQACPLRTSRAVTPAPYFQPSTFDFQPPLRALPFASHCKSARIRDECP